MNMNHSNNMSESNNPSEIKDAENDWEHLDASDPNSNGIKHREVSQENQETKEQISEIDLKHSDDTDVPNTRVDDNQFDGISPYNTNDGHEYPSSLSLSPNTYSSDSLLDADEELNYVPPTIINAIVIVHHDSDEKLSHLTIQTTSIESEVDLDEADDEIYLKPTDFCSSSSDPSVVDEDDYEYNTDDQCPGLHVVNSPFPLMPMSPSSIDEDDDDDFGLSDGSDSSRSSVPNKEI
ncbi:hypothetical protein Aperf_G00000055655 [Anoplocephala perfoliata]